MLHALKCLYCAHDTAEPLLFGVIEDEPPIHDPTDNMTKRFPLTKNTSHTHADTSG